MARAAACGPSPMTTRGGSATRCTGDYPPSTATRARTEPGPITGGRAVDSFRTRLLRCGAMPPAPPSSALQCLRCRAVYRDPRLFTGCPRCARESVNVNLSVAFDPAALGALTSASFPAAPRSLWRFRALLPLGDAEPVSLGEGATPLVRMGRLGRRLGLTRLYAKDESQNPTWSYKDRLCSLAVTHAMATGARVVTISSTGNHGASTAAYAARAGLPCVIFTLASVPDTMKTLMQAYGAAVVACPTSESRWVLMKEGIERHGWYPTSGWSIPPIGSNPFGVEGYKTIACEIAEDLDWMAPDVVAVPSCYSDGLFGIWKGWTELNTLGLVKTRPRMLAAEPHGPLAHALAHGLETPEKVTAGSSVAFSIASPYGTYQGLAALRESGGLGVPITDEGIFEAQRMLAGEEGIYAEPSAIVGLTAVMPQARQNTNAADDVVVGRLSLEDL